MSESLYCGQRLSAMTRDQLIEAVESLGRELSDTRIEHMRQLSIIGNRRKDDRPRFPERG